MQNDLKQTIRFDDFYALFGDQGVVAMAWWLGGQLADPIREKQHSFPFLHICGEPGSGKTFLLEYLSKLTEPQSVSRHDPLCATRVTRSRILANPAVQVLVYEPSQRADSLFDWNEIKALYNGDTCFSHAPTNAENAKLNFKGALVICANEPVECSEAVESRFAHVQLTNAAQTTESRRQANELHQLDAEQAGAFGKAITLSKSQLLDDINKLAPIHTTALLEEHADQLSARAAKNGGQLMALIDVLSLMLGLTNQQRVNALSAVKYSICADFIPY